MLDNKKCEYTGFEYPGFIVNFYYDSDSKKLKVVRTCNLLEKDHTKIIDLNEDFNDCIGWLFYERSNAQEDLKKLKVQVEESKDLKLSMMYREQLLRLISLLQGKVDFVNKSINEAKKEMLDEKERT